MMMFGYLVMTGITTGALYALVALGITVVYKATKAVNFAHGDLFMLSGFVAYTFHVMWGVEYVVALLLAVAVAFVIGAVSERIVFRPVVNHGMVSVLLATVGLSFVLKGIARGLWGGKGDFIPFPPLVDGAPVMIAGIPVTPQQLAVLAGAVAIMVGFGLFVRFTRFGRIMQATADNTKAARLIGIRIERVYMYTFAVGTALAGAAAVLMAPITLLYPDIGFVLFIKAFAAAVLGGLTSIPGAVVGGFAIGLIEALAGGYIDTNLQDVSAYIVIMLVLAFLPNGLLGGPVARRV
ncbi:MAG TPA: branched-chain amino acid ABC transporter permease [Rhodopila sp.]|uniref:branched-chain amino acid ABC transporter permease n=1 Tax=Rhodopila sp. TaxID=2480087 RepID=UPI002CC718FF|nr:branched-chain amino acid ABC transporter permease [Rhodopila sp.]HVY16333.1 branched-chain amino acid ABC transporter permease [Rhodopila sp.]